MFFFLKKLVRYFHYSKYFMCLNLCVIQHKIYGSFSCCCSGVSGSWLNLKSSNKRLMVVWLWKYKKNIHLMKNICLTRRTSVVDVLASEGREREEHWRTRTAVTKTTGRGQSCNLLQLHQQLTKRKRKIKSFLPASPPSPLHPTQYFKSCLNLSLRPDTSGSERGSLLTSAAVSSSYSSSQRVPVAPSLSAAPHLPVFMVQSVCCFGQPVC